MKSLNRVRLFVTPWTVAYQAPPSMGFSRQECWSGLPFPSPRLKIKCTINVIPLNCPQTIPPPPPSMEKLSSTKPVPGAKKVEDHWRGRLKFRDISDPSPLQQTLSQGWRSWHSFSAPWELLRQWCGQVGCYSSLVGADHLLGMLEELLEGEEED